MLRLTVVLLLAAVSGYGAEAWVPIGPRGGAVKALVLDPSVPRTLYAGVHSRGVYKSVDGGASWTLRSSGLDAGARQTQGSTP